MSLIVEPINIVLNVAAEKNPALPLLNLKLSPFKPGMNCYGLVTALDQNSATVETEFGLVKTDLIEGLYIGAPVELEMLQGEKLLVRLRQPMESRVTEDIVSSSKPDSTYDYITKLSDAFLIAANELNLYSKLHGFDKSFMLDHLKQRLSVELQHCPTEKHRSSIISMFLIPFFHNNLLQKIVCFTRENTVETSSARRIIIELEHKKYNRIWIDCLFTGKSIGENLYVTKVEVSIKSTTELEPQLKDAIEKVQPGNCIKPLIDFACSTTPVETLV